MVLDRNGVASAKEHVPTVPSKGLIPPQPTTVPPSMHQAAWNTKNLPLRAASDAASAACAAGLIAPLITIFDR